MSGRPTLVLISTPRIHAEGAIDAAPNAPVWDAIYDSPEAARGRVAAPIVSVPPNVPLPRVDGGGTLWIRDFDQLAAALDIEVGWSVIVFEPSDTTMLDQFRLNRPTLVARQAITAGARLTLGHLAMTRGGLGISAEHLDRIVGLRVHYNLESGDAITFGVLDTCGDEGAALSSVRLADT